MKKLILVSLIFLNIHTITNCMKRKNDDTVHPVETYVYKKAKNELEEPIVLRNFFIENEFFEKPIADFETLMINQITKTTNHKPQFIPRLPTDIKNLIRTCQFFDNKQWWYPTTEYEFKETPYAIAFTPDKLAIGIDKDIYLIDPNKEDQLCDLLHVEHYIYSIATNNNHLAYGFHNGNVEIIDLTTKKRIFNCISNNPACSIAFDKENQHLAIGRENKEIEIHSIKEKKTTFCCTTTARPYGLSFLDNNNLIVGHFNGNVSIIDLTKNITEDYLKSLGGLYSFTINNNKKKIAIGSENGIVKIIDQKTNNVIVSTDFKKPIYSLSFDEKGERLAIGTDNHYVNILKQFHPTADQLMLRYLLHLLFQVKKLNKDTIKHPHCLLYLMATVFRLNPIELITTWNSFPEQMKTAIWKKTNRLIEEYGHNLCSIKDFTDNNPLIQAMEEVKLYPNLMEDYPLSIPSQLLSLKVIQLFCETQTIKEPFSSPEELIKFIAYFYNLDHSSLLVSWSTFPQNAKTKIYHEIRQLLQQEKD